MSKPIVTEEQKQAARRAPLAAWLLEHEPDGWTKDSTGNYRSKANHSLIVSNSRGYIDFAAPDGERRAKGNAIDYLMVYLNYTFTAAVAELCNFSPNAPLPVSHTPTVFSIPEHDKNNNKVFAYLTESRKISGNLVRRLMQDGILYQALTPYCNGCCLSATQDYAILFGLSPERKFYGIAKGSRYGGYWSFGDLSATQIYVTESAIDAMSLCCLQITNGSYTPSLYAAIAGLKDAAIANIQRDYPHASIIIATDNDEAGNNYADKHAGFTRITPKLKDWNDDLMAIK